MATQDISAEDEVLDDDEVVETNEDNSEEDENSEDDNTEDDADTEDDEDDSDDDSDEDDSDDEEEDEPEFKKAFSNIKGDTPDEYIPNLEEAYRKSSREAKRLVQEGKEKQEKLDKIMAAAAKDPDLAKQLNEATDGEATVDPALAKVRQDYEDSIKADLDTFMSDHPDLEDDEELTDEFMENVAILGKAARKKGRVLRPLDAYKRAWKMLDRDDSSDKVVDAVKKTASKPKTSSKKKASAKTEKAVLTKEQIAFGKKFGLSEEQLLANAKSNS